MANTKTRQTKTIVAIALQAALAFLARGLEAQPLDGWKMVWSDEFNGAGLDSGKWALELNEGDPGMTIYTNRSQNLSVSGGQLALQAQKENYGGKQFTSTQISTRNKAAWKYCRIDVRAKLPYGQGMWPAIWMMPTQPAAYGVWPRSGEIDIMENLGHNTRLTYTNLHFGAGNQSIQGTYTTPANQSLSDAFHVYTMIWDSTSFSFTLDSAHTYYSPDKWSPDNVAFPKPFEQPFFLILDLAVGGSWGGPPDSSTVFPQKMLVDWVHVYQRQNTSAIRPQPASPGTAGYQPPAYGQSYLPRWDGASLGLPGFYDGLGRTSHLPNMPP
ncbi:MAG: glycoside hydrolase family 16 protein [Fibrobacteria bacterium]